MSLMVHKAVNSTPLIFCKRLQMKPMMNSSLIEMHSDSSLAENYPLWVSLSVPVIDQ